MNYGAIEIELDQRLNTYNIEVSNEAKEIVIRAIQAIEIDPNPDWRQPVFGSQLDSVQMDMIAASSLKLLGMYTQVAARRSSGRRVTTFDLLHIISKWLDDICPFEKVGGP